MIPSRIKDVGYDQNPVRCGRIGFDAGVFADAAVFVYDRAVNISTVADADCRAVVVFQRLFAFVLVVVGSHDHGIANRHVLADSAPQADHTVFDHGSFVQFHNRRQSGCA